MKIKLQDLFVVPEGKWIIKLIEELFERLISFILKRSCWNQSSVCKFCLLGSKWHPNDIKTAERLYIFQTNKLSSTDYTLTS